MNQKKRDKIEEIILGVICIIILLGGTVISVFGLIAAVIHFSWESLLMIPFFLLILLVCCIIPLGLVFSPKAIKEFSETIKQVHDVE